MSGCDGDNCVEACDLMQGTFMWSLTLCSRVSIFKDSLIIRSCRIVIICGYLPADPSSPGSGSNVFLRFIKAHIVYLQLTDNAAIVRFCFFRWHPV